jgi:hypothetical protein
MSRKTEPNRVAGSDRPTPRSRQPTKSGRDITSSIRRSMGRRWRRDAPTGGGIEPKPTPFTELTLSSMARSIPCRTRPSILPGQHVFVTSDIPMGEAFLNRTVSSLQIRTAAALRAGNP